MTPSHTRKRGKLYRYYVAIDTIKTGARSFSVNRVPADQIEQIVIAQVRTLLQSPEIIVATWRAAKQTIKGLTERSVRDELFRFEQLWSELFPAEQARIIQLLVERIAVSESGADITLRIDGLTTVLKDLRGAQDREAA